MYTQSAAAERSNFDLRDSLAVLRRRKWTIIVVTLVVTAVASLVRAGKGDDHVPDHAVTARDTGEADEPSGPAWRRRCRRPSAAVAESPGSS